MWGAPETTHQMVMECDFGGAFHVFIRSTIYLSQSVHSSTSRMTRILTLFDSHCLTFRLKGEEEDDLTNVCINYWHSDKVNWGQAEEYAN